MTMHRLGFWMRLVFILACVVFLVIGVAAGTGNDPAQNEQRFSALLATMTAGFPLAFFGSGLLSDLAAKSGLVVFDVAAGPITLFGGWIIATVLGYAQWFVLIPRIARAIRRVCSGRKSSPPLTRVQGPDSDAR
jgi:hypothetical protein